LKQKASIEESLPKTTANENRYDKFMKFLDNVDEEISSQKGGVVGNTS
jgi:hypothetical protein